MRDDHHRRLERMYLAAPTNRIHEPEIRVGDGEAEIVLPVKPLYFHGGGAAHGSYCFRVLDDAAFFALSSVVEDELLVTASFHLHFLRPVRAGRLRATGRATTRSRRLLVGEAVAVDERGREIARGSGTFVRSGLPLVEVPGYADPDAADPPPEG